ncbi:MAG: calcium/sodium antiporter [Psychromonas sp.]|nr:calcium/sodium antiporter [Psychromonas sp.]
MTLLLPIVALILGFVLLIWSGDKFIFGASNTARSFGISPLIVGVVIIGLGTSAPEMLVSAMAAINGKTGISIGNAIGSNIANIGLVLGLTALFYPLKIHNKLVKREMPILLALILLSYFLLWDGRLDFIDGVVLFSVLFAIFTYAVFATKKSEDDPISQELIDELPEKTTRKAALKWLFIGIVVLISSSHILVWGAIAIAKFYQVSDLIIGLTIIAIGTSLPELAATIIAARKKEFDLAIGNIVGSNIFNTLGVIGISGLIYPSGFDPKVLTRDYPIMIGFSIVLMIFTIAWRKRKNGRLGRFKGALLLIAYVAYSAWLFIEAQIIPTTMI